MKNIALAFLVFSLLFITSCDKEKKDLVDTNENEIVDINSLQTFENEIQSGVSLVFFHASWCSTCAAQRPAVEAVSMKNEFSSVFFGEVEFEDNTDINQEYSISGFPTIVIFKDGVEQYRNTGSGNTEETLSSNLEALL